MHSLEEINGLLVWKETANIPGYLVSTCGDKGVSCKGMQTE